MADESFSHLRLRTLIDSYMEEIPAELTMDILSRLPVKTIIHCKRVCKKWRNLLSDSFFVKLHLSRSPTGLMVHHNPRICANPGIMKWVEIEDKVDHHHLHYDRLLTLDLFDVAPIYTKMRQVGSVNGLICLWHYGHEVDNTYICNPVTREYMILPRQRFQKDVFFLGVVVYGFGASSLTGEYKVVRAFHAKKVVPDDVTRAGQPSVLEAEVYTLGTGQWRSLPPVPVTYRLKTFDKYCGTFLNNHCHWIVFDNKNSLDDKICTFDLDKETFQSFPSPPVKENRYAYHQSLAILKGCLCVLYTYDSELTIWVMKDYGINNSWCKQVVNRTIQWPKFQQDNHIHLIEGLKDGSFLMVFENKVCVIDPRRKTIEDTKFFEHLSSGWAYHPSFLNLRSFESERIRLF